MIPTETAKEDDLKPDFALETNLPTYTYRLNIVTHRVQGHTDGQAAMQQVIYKILRTERYKYPKVYSDNYGVELLDLIGQPVPYVLPELERRITEALTWDERIAAVDSFDFEVKKSKVFCKFTAHTIFGDLEEEVAVNF